MIHYHGSPLSGPNDVAIRFFKGRHAFVSFERPAQLEIVAEQCQSFALDNGAFFVWKRGAIADWDEYLRWALEWAKHPGCDFALIPDVIDGSERENDELVAWWYGESNLARRLGVPVWHLHESLERLMQIACSWPRVALGSSGDFADVGSFDWWQRIGEAMDAICDEQGRPPCKLHGLRMLDPTVFSQLPFASADSTNVARNIGIDSAWDNAPYAPKSLSDRALIIAGNVEMHPAAATWQRTFGHQHNLALFG